jgi:hypothetical protein
MATHNKAKASSAKGMADREKLNTTIPINNAPHNNSTKQYLELILTLQVRHLPPNATQLMTGIKSAALSLRPQLGHEDGTKIDFFVGNL